MVGSASQVDVSHHHSRPSSLVVTTVTFRYRPHFGCCNRRQLIVHELILKTREIVNMKWYVTDRETYLPKVHGTQATNVLSCVENWPTGRSRPLGAGKLYPSRAADAGSTDRARARARACACVCVCVRRSAWLVLAAVGRRWYGATVDGWMQRHGGATVFKTIRVANDPICLSQSPNDSAHFQK